MNKITVMVQKIASLLVMGLLSTTSFAANPTGMLRLCREADLGEPAQTKLNRAMIRLPTGLLLEDVGARSDLNSFEHKWPLEIITLKPVEMRPGTRCLIVPAIISPLSKVRSVSPADDRDLEIDGIATPDGQLNANVNLPPSWDWTPNIQASVEREFK